MRCSNFSTSQFKTLASCCCCRFFSGPVYFFSGCLKLFLLLLLVEVVNSARLSICVLLLLLLSDNVRLGHGRWIRGGSTTTTRTKTTAATTTTTPKLWVQLRVQLQLQRQTETIHLLPSKAFETGLTVICWDLRLSFWIFGVSVFLIPIPLAAGPWKFPMKWLKNVATAGLEHHHMPGSGSDSSLGFIAILISWKKQNQKIKKKEWSQGTTKKIQQSSPFLHVKHNS